MAQIKKPIIKAEEGSKSGLGTIGQLAGTAIGAYFGGPSGAALGGQLGGTAGGLAAGAVDKPGTAAREGGGVETSGDAMSRRMGSLQTDNLSTLRDSLEALPSASPEIRQKYAEPLLTAFTMEAQKRKQNG